MSEKIMDPQAKKYRRKLVTYIVLAVTAVAIIFFIILAYIGSLIGNYTISLKNEGMNLTMADNVGFNNATSRLRATSVPTTVPITADDLPGNIALDGTDGSHNGVVDDNEYHNYYGDGMYLAYTFYMRNLGDTPVAYEHIIQIEELFIEDNEQGIDEILRLRLYENRVDYNDDGTITTTHDYKTYAKIKQVADLVTVPDENGDPIIRSENRECISDSYTESRNGRTITVCSARKEENAQRAELFYSETDIVHNGADGTRFIYGRETIRFTIVAWLEGADPEAVGEVPYNPSITLSSQINALHILPSEEQENS